jgi:radical SAM superfamily enzyme YgiQ (UPF0313 family)
MIYDGIVEVEKYSTRLKKFCPDVVVITGYITQEESIKKYITISKKIFPNCKIILGGVHAQLNFKRLFWEAVDYIVRSESMQDFQQLLITLQDDKGMEHINGLCYRKQGAFIVNSYVPADVSLLPIPDRICLKEHADAFRYMDLERVATLKTAVSCPYMCNFCYGRNLHGGVYQARCIERVIREIKTIPVDTIFIVDSDFLLDTHRLSEFIQQIKDNHIHKKYICYGRADFIANNEQLIRELCEIGFDYFLVGIEGIHNQTLKAYNKQISVNINEQCIDTLSKNDATCVALMIIDLNFSKQDFKDLYLWVKKQPLKYVSIQIYTPIPPTDIYTKNEQKLLTRDTRKWDLAHAVLNPSHMSVRRFQWHYSVLMLKLFLLGKKRGAYKFVTAQYVWSRFISYLQRLFTLR